MEKPFRRIATSADDAERLASPSTESAMLNLRRSLMSRRDLLRPAAREVRASQFQRMTMIVFALHQTAFGTSCSLRGSLSRHIKPVEMYPHPRMAARRDALQNADDVALAAPLGRRLARNLLWQLEL